MFVVGIHSVLTSPSIAMHALTSEMGHVTRQGLTQLPHVRTYAVRPYVAPIASPLPPGAYINYDLLRDHRRIPSQEMQSILETYKKGQSKHEHDRVQDAIDDLLHYNTFPKSQVVRVLKEYINDLLQQQTDLDDICCSFNHSISSLPKLKAKLQKKSNLNFETFQEIKKKKSKNRSKELPAKNYVNSFQEATSSHNLKGEQMALHVEESLFKLLQDYEDLNRKLYNLGNLLHLNVPIAQQKHIDELLKEVEKTKTYKKFKELSKNRFFFEKSQPKIWNQRHEEEIEAKKISSQKNYDAERFYSWTQWQQHKKRQEEDMKVTVRHGDYAEEYGSSTWNDKTGYTPFY